LCATTSSDSRHSRSSTIVQMPDGKGPKRSDFAHSDRALPVDDGGGARELTFLRTKIPLQDEWKVNENDLSLLSIDSHLIKSASSNNLLEKEVEYFGDIFPDRNRSRSGGVIIWVL